MPDITDITDYEIDTHFGKPSGTIRIGTLRGKRVAFLPRHGVGHIYTPTTVPYQANIYALKTLGVRFIIAVNACGSLREDYAPGHIVTPDQIVDYTISTRPRTFFDDGMVAHISVAEPTNPILRQLMVEGVRANGGTAHEKGTFLIEDGPRFATRAESLIFKQWGCDIIGMTTAPEVFLAREAEIAYASMAHITDYDSWHESEAPVTVDMVTATFKKNIKLAQAIISHTVENLDENQIVPEHSALNNAIMTAKDKISPQMIEKLRPIVARTLKLDN
jgi:5'-methylthioadenosine phosphorylase